MSWEKYYFHITNDLSPCVCPHGTPLLLKYICIYYDSLQWKIYGTEYPLTGKYAPLKRKLLTNVHMLENKQQLWYNWMGQLWAWLQNPEQKVKDWFVNSERKNPNSQILLIVWSIFSLHHSDYNQSWKLVKGESVIPHKITGRHFRTMF